MKYPTVLRWSPMLQERASVRSAGGSGSANQNHSTSLARAISYLAEVERLSLLMPPSLLDPPSFASPLLKPTPTSLFSPPHFFFFYPRFFSLILSLLLSPSSKNSQLHLSFLSSNRTSSASISFHFFFLSNAFFQSLVTHC